MRGCSLWAAISETQHMQLYITWMVAAQHSKLLHSSDSRDGAEQVV